MKKFVLRLKFRRQGCRSIAGLVVPGADILTDVATKNMMANTGAQLFWNAAALFNGEIGDAAAGVEFAGSDQRLGGACIDAARTTPATVSGGKIGSQFQ